MRTKTYILLVVSLPLLVSCATTDDIDRLNRRIIVLENKTDNISSNQNALHNDFLRLQNESEKEFDRNKDTTRQLENRINSVKKKTDIFKVQNIEGNLKFTTE